MRCSKCGATIGMVRNFATNAPLQWQQNAPAAGRSTKPGAKFCDECGESLTASAPKSEVRSESPARVLHEETAAAPRHGQRKAVTALFADIKARWSC
jgi:hypothetical protein